MFLRSFYKETMTKLEGIYWIRKKKRLFILLLEGPKYLITPEL